MSPSAKPKILWVDDDPNIISATQRFLRKDYEVHSAGNGAEGLVALEKEGPFAVIISDLKMPVMDGIEFLTEANKRAPDTVRTMLTGFADQDVAIEAVNRGQIFRFLTKPCHTDAIRSAIAAGVRQHELILAEREVLEKTLIGSIQVMSDILALTNPLAFNHVRAVQALARQVAAAMELPNIWRLEAAVVLSQLGVVTVPGETIEKHFRGKRLEPHERQMITAHPKIAKDLIAHIPRLSEVSEIIALHSGSSNTTRVQAREPLELAAHILFVTFEYERYLARGLSRDETLKLLRELTDQFNPDVVEALAEAEIDHESTKRCCLPVEELADGMKLDEDVKTLDGMLLIPRGLTVNETIRYRLRNFQLQEDIADKVWVLVRSEHSEPTPEDLEAGAMRDTGDFPQESI